MVKYWETYTCEKCDNYPMISLVLNISPIDNVTAWHTAHTLGGKLLVNLNSGNGKEFFNMLQTDVTALQEFIIKPDFTWESTKEIASDSTSPAIGSDFFTSKGIYPHTNCDPVNINIINNEVKNPFVIDIENNSLIMNVISDNIYSIKLFSANGKNISTISNQEMMKGSNKLKIGPSNLSNGSYIAEINCEGDISRQKIIVK